jgi:hypothetical protein
MMKAIKLHMPEHEVHTCEAVVAESKVAEPVVTKTTVVKEITVTKDAPIVEKKQEVLIDPIKEEVKKVVETLAVEKAVVETTPTEVLVSEIKTVPE